MDKELMRIQLIMIINELRNISNDLDVVGSLYDNMIGNMKKNLLVNDRIIGNDFIQNDKKEVINIHKEIVSGIIPRIHNLY